MFLVRDFLADQKVLRRPDAPAAPAVSVVLPTFQRCAGGLLRGSVASVLSQSFGDLELIVVDDGSVDGTYDLLLELQRADPRVVVIRHEVNSGLPALRVNEGIELARGRWIAFQFDDDEWLDGGLEALVEAADATTGPSVVFGRADWVADGWRTELPRREVSLTHLASHNDIANNAVLVSRRLLELRGLYDPHVAMRRLCDWDLWLRLIVHAPFVAVDRLVSRVPFVSDETAIGVTAPVDLPLVRYLMSIHRDEHLSLDAWRDYRVDAVQVAGVDLPDALAERLELEQLAPFRARFERPAPAPPARRRQAAAPRVLVCTADQYDPWLGFRVGHYDALRNAGYKHVFHHLWELDRSVRPRVVVDLLLCLQTDGSSATAVVTEMGEEGTPTACYLDEGCLGVLADRPGSILPMRSEPMRVELERRLAAVDAVWSTSPAVSRQARRINPRTLPHRPSVPEGWLPAALGPRGGSGRLRVGCVGAAGWHDEARATWDAIHAVAGRWRDRVEFEIWGLEIDQLPPLPSPVVRRPFPASSPLLLDRLRHSRWDVLLATFRTPAPTAPIPPGHLLAAVSGALGIVSDAPESAELRHGLIGLEADGAAAAWEAAIEDALTMPVGRFDAIRRHLVELVRREFTAEAQIHVHEAACLATAFHAATRRRRVGGTPRILYVFGAGPAPGCRPALLDAAEWVQRYGVAAHAVCPAEAIELRSDLTERGISWCAVASRLLDGTTLPGADEAPLRSALAAIRPSCVHVCSTDLPAVAAACARLGLPLAVTPPDWWTAPVPDLAMRASELPALYYGCIKESTGG